MSIYQFAFLFCLPSAFDNGNEFPFWIVYEGSKLHTIATLLFNCHFYCPLVLASKHKLWKPAGKLAFP
jgi:hypothetical protein